MGRPNRGEVKRVQTFCLAAKVQERIPRKEHPQGSGACFLLLQNSWVNFNGSDVPEPRICDEPPPDTSRKGSETLLWRQNTSESPAKVRGFNILAS